LGATASTNRSWSGFPYSMVPFCYPSFICC